jgi:GTP-binding protein
MTFVDECVVFVQAGRGGAGAASFHSEPYKPRGGPDGGNGGAGGLIALVVDGGLHDLRWLADHPHQKAASGRPGRSARRDGASGGDKELRVPDGTVVFDDEGLLADLVGEGSRAVVARGGRGGRGNATLAGPRDRVPRVAEPGEEGESRRLRLEVRTVADVGIVGLPNAGKSTLLSRLTNARPKIGDYPFTTLSPNLGVAGAEERFVLADIPGLVRGAAAGKGLGHRFLRHVVRCRALVLVVDLAVEEPAEDLAVLRAELAAYDPELATRPSIVVGAKVDLVGDGPVSAAARLDDDAITVSALTGEGMPELADRLGQFARESAAAQPARRPYVVLRPGRPAFTVTRADDGRFRVAGRAVERWVAETDLDDERQVAGLQRRLKKEGVDRKLASIGARVGDEIEIGGRIFEYVPDRVDPDPSAPNPGDRGSP